MEPRLFRKFVAHISKMTGTGGDVTTGAVTVNQPIFKIDLRRRMLAVNRHGMNVRLSLHNWSYISSARQIKEIKPVVAKMHNDLVSTFFGQTFYGGQRINQITLFSTMHNFDHWRTPM